MSQEKVELKKIEKKNRKSTVRKKKIEYALSMTLVAIISLAIVSWIGYSIYTKAAAAAAANAEYEYHDVSTQAIQDYLEDVE